MAIFDLISPDIYLPFPISYLYQTDTDMFFKIYTIQYQFTVCSFETEFFLLTYRTTKMSYFSSKSYFLIFWCGNFDE